MQEKFSESYVQDIVALLNSNDENLRAGAAHAVAYIVDNNCTVHALYQFVYPFECLGRHKTILRNYGTVAKLVELLSHNASPDVQEAAARAIRGVVRNESRGITDTIPFLPWRYNVNKDLYHSIRSSGAVNALANLLKNNHAGCRQAALSALWQISATADNNFRRQVADACTPKSVVAALSDEDAHTHYFALNLIGNLTVGNGAHMLCVLLETNLSDPDHVMEQYLVAGVVPQLKHLQASQDPDVQNLAYNIYLAYTRNRSRFNILSYSGYSVR